MLRMSQRHAGSSTTRCKSANSQLSISQISNLHRPAHQDAQLQQRRAVLLLGAGVAMGLSVQPANAAPLSTPVDLARVFSQAPEPVKFPRKALDQRFAVLLMRSSYDAVDKLDFIPMNDFQAKFWLLRQSELEPYTMQYAPLRPRQGDLTDPLYFDFISFSQFATVAREMPKGLTSFKEYCEDCPGQSRAVVRDPAMSDNAQLPKAFFEMTGEAIYSGLRFGFDGVEYGAPAPCSFQSSLKDVTEGVQEVLTIMVDHGYALRANVHDVKPLPGNPRAGTFGVSIQGAANQWGLMALKYRQASVMNTYDACTVDAFLRASGRTATFEMDVGNVGIEEKWTVMAA